MTVHSALCMCVCTHYVCVLCVCVCVCHYNDAAQNKNKQEFYLKDKVMINILSLNDFGLDASKPVRIIVKVRMPICVSYLLWVFFGVVHSLML